MEADVSLASRLVSLWTESSDWVSSHTGLIAWSALSGAAIVALLYGAKLFGRWLVSREASRTAWGNVLGRTLARTHLWFMIAVAAQVIAWLGRAPPEIAGPVRIAFVAATGLQIAVWARALILGAIERHANEADPHDNLQSAVGLIRILVTAGLFLLAAILILANVGVDVNGLLAGLGIGGIAIGLAAQGIFSDLFAALSILFDKPFRKGDLIRFDTTIGTVEYIGLKSSRIRALSGEEIIISNANLLGKELRNFAKMEQRRLTQLLSLVMHTAPDRCAALPDIMQAAVSSCPGAHFVRCGLETFGASSLDFSLIYDIDVDDQADVLERRNGVNLAILRAFSEEGYAFAYPTQTTFTAAPGGQLVMPYAAPASVL